MQLRQNYTKAFDTNVEGNKQLKIQDDAEKYQQ